MKKKQFKFFAHTNNNILNPDYDDHDKFDNELGDELDSQLYIDSREKYDYLIQQEENKKNQKPTQ